MSTTSFRAKHLNATSANPRVFRGLTVRQPLLLGGSSLVLYGISVSAAVNTLCTQEVRHGSLVAQACQYVFVIFSGMLMGIVTGPPVERTTHDLCRLFSQPPGTANFRRTERRISTATLIFGSLVSLLFLLQQLNQFVDTHPVFKTEVLTLVYAMGVLMGCAWFILLHRQSGWGLLASSAMSMMVVSTTLSLHSWS